jgi:hypothetical protein
VMVRKRKALAFRTQKTLRGRNQHILVPPKKLGMSQTPKVFTNGSERGVYYPNPVKPSTFQQINPSARMNAGDFPCCTGLLSVEEFPSSPNLI